MRNEKGENGGGGGFWILDFGFGGLVFFSDVSPRIAARSGGGTGLMLILNIFSLCAGLDSYCFVWFRLSLSVSLSLSLFLTNLL